MDVKGRLQELMEARGWTIYRVAKEAGIPWSTVNNMFKRNTEPSVYTLEALCNGMGITLAQFFDTDNKMGLSAEQQMLVNRYNMLDKRERKLVSDLLEALTQRQRCAAEPGCASGCAEKAGR